MAFLAQFRPAPSLTASQARNCLRFHGIAKVKRRKIRQKIFRHNFGKSLGVNTLCAGCLRDFCGWIWEWFGNGLGMVWE